MSHSVYMIESPQERDGIKRGGPEGPPLFVHQRWEELLLLRLEVGDGARHVVAGSAGGAEGVLRQVQAHLGHDAVQRTDGGSGVTQLVGLVLQQHNLIPTLSALENVALPASHTGQPKAARLARAQQQRLSIARAVMNGGSVILADGPTGALDADSGRQVMALLSDLAASPQAGCARR